MHTVTSCVDWRYYGDLSLKRTSIEFHLIETQGIAMKMNFCKPAIPLLLGIAVASGCTWVDPLPGASTVTLVTPSHVTNCRSIGTTSSRVENKIGFVNRSEEKVAEELLTLAQNSAVELGGDTLVAEGPPSEGTQKFRIYKCQY